MSNITAIFKELFKDEELICTDILEDEFYTWYKDYSRGEIIEEENNYNNWDDFTSKDIDYNDELKPEVKEEKLKKLICKRLIDSHFSEDEAKLLSESSESADIELQYKFIAYMIQHYWEDTLASGDKYNLKNIKKLLEDHSIEFEITKEDVDKLNNYDKIVEYIEY